MSAQQHDNMANEAAITQLGGLANAMAVDYRDQAG
jgi:hypothetical protein